MQVQVFKLKKNGERFKKPVAKYEVANVVEAEQQFNSDPKGRASKRVRKTPLNFFFLVIDPAVPVAPEAQNPAAPAMA